MFFSGFVEFGSTNMFVGSLENLVEAPWCLDSPCFLCVCFHFPVRCSLSEWMNVEGGATVSLRSVHPTRGFQTVARAL